MNRSAEHRLGQSLNLSKRAEPVLGASFVRSMVEMHDSVILDAPYESERRSPIRRVGERHIAARLAGDQRSPVGLDELGMTRPVALAQFS